MQHPRKRFTWVTLTCHSELGNASSTPIHKRCRRFQCIRSNHLTWWSHACRRRDARSRHDIWTSGSPRHLFFYPPSLLGPAPYDRDVPESYIKLINQPLLGLCCPQLQILSASRSWTCIPSNTHQYTKKIPPNTYIPDVSALLPQFYQSPETLYCFLVKAKHYFYNH